MPAVDIKDNSKADNSMVSAWSFRMADIHSDISKKVILFKLLTSKKSPRKASKSLNN